MDARGIQKVCETLNLDMSGEYGVGTRRGAHISISCPLAIKTHSDPWDDNLSCSVKVDPDGPSVAFCHSISCGFKGTLTQLVEQAQVMRPGRKDIISLIAWLVKNEKTDVSAKCSRVKRRISKKKDDQARVFERRKDTRDVLPEDRLSFDKSYHPYAETRGISPESWERWELQFDEKRQRLVFPVRDRDGHLVGLTGRDVTGDRHPKWFNYSGLNKARYLYGAWLIEPGSLIILVEGPVDAVVVSQNLPGVSAVACMGSGLSKDHVETIRNSRPKKVYIFPDGDGAGRVMAMKASKMLKPLALRLMKTPKGQDPASLDRFVTEGLFNSSSPILANIRWSPR